MFSSFASYRGLLLSRFCSNNSFSCKLAISPRRLCNRSQAFLDKYDPITTTSITMITINATIPPEMATAVWVVVNCKTSSISELDAFYSSGTQCNQIAKQNRKLLIAFAWHSIGCSHCTTNTTGCSHMMSKKQKDNYHNMFLHFHHKLHNRHIVFQMEFHHNQYYKHQFNWKLCTKIFHFHGKPSIYLGEVLGMRWCISGDHIP